MITAYKYFTDVNSELQGDFASGSSKAEKSLTVTLYIFHL